MSPKGSTNTDRSSLNKNADCPNQRTRMSATPRKTTPRSVSERLPAAGRRAAVAARVTRACSHHPATAPRALDRVLVRVEERRLARRRYLERGRLGCAVCVRGRHARPHLRREDADLLLLVDGQELLAHPAEHVIDDRLRCADVGVV